MENGIKISELTEAASVSKNTYIPVVEDNSNYKIKAETLLDSVQLQDPFPTGGSVGQVLKKTSTGVAWGNDNDTISTWSNLSGKPQTFTPSQHTHTKSEITDLNNATQYVDGLMSKEDKTKLDGLSQTDEYTLPTASSSTLGGVKIGYSNNSKNYAVQLDSNDRMYVNVPWEDNNTTYEKATTSSDGLMSKEDKSKLDGLGLGGDYVLPAANSTSLGGIKTGYSTNDKNYAVVLDGDNKAYVNVPWTDTNTTYTNATTLQAGLMSAADKLKLDGLGQSGDYVLPTASSSILGGIKTGYSTSGKNYAIQIDSNSNAYVNVPWTDTTYNNASSSNAGLMSAGDKNKLDNILSGATNVQYSSKLSSGVNIGTITINGTATQIYAPEGGAISDSNTTYTFANGSNGSFTVTPSNGSAQTVTIGKPATAGVADSANSVQWTNIQGKPSVYTPETHTHTISNITDFPSVATQSSNGLMSSADKIKLDSLSSTEIQSDAFALNLDDTSQATENSSNNWTLTSTVLEALVDAILKKKVIAVFLYNRQYIATIENDESPYLLYLIHNLYDANPSGSGRTYEAMQIDTFILKITQSTRIAVLTRTDYVQLRKNGSTSKFLSEAGTYNEVGSATATLNGATLDYGNYMYITPNNSSHRFRIYGGYIGVTIDNEVDSNIGITFNYDSSNFSPKNNFSSISLGTSSIKWTDLYLSGSVLQASDISLKENIKPIDVKDDLRFVEFTWKATKEKGYGVIALEVEKYYPELVYGEDGLKSVNYIGLHTIKIAQLENEVKQLKEQINSLLNNK